MNDSGNAEAKKKKLMASKFNNGFFTTFSLFLRFEMVFIHIFSLPGVGLEIGRFFVLLPLLFLPLKRKSEMRDFFLLNEF